MTISDVKLANCAACRIEVLGESMLRPGVHEEVLDLFADDAPKPIGGRIDERPYCQTCYLTLTRRYRRYRRERSSNQ